MHIDTTGNSERENIAFVNRRGVGEGLRRNPMIPPRSKETA